MLLLSMAVALAAAATATPSSAEESFGTAKEAEALVARAVAHVKAEGAEKAYQQFTDKDGGFVDRDLYIVVYGLDGLVLAHGQHAKLVGENLLDLRDPDGKPWVKERIRLAREKGKFWHDYKFVDPITRKTLDKATYCERLDETVICAGIYKR